MINIGNKVRTRKGFGVVCQKTSCRPRIVNADLLLTFCLHWNALDMLTSNISSSEFQYQYLWRLKRCTGWKGAWDFGASVILKHRSDIVLQWKDASRFVQYDLHSVFLVGRQRSRSRRPPSRCVTWRWHGEELANNTRKDNRRLPMSRSKWGPSPPYVEIQYWLIVDVWAHKAWPLPCLKRVKPHFARCIFQQAGY